MTSSYFRNKTVWITGASSGIGKAFAVFLSDKVDTLIISSRTKEKLDRLANELSRHCKIVVQVMDMAIEESIRHACDEVLKNNEIDILFNNAGISQRSKAYETEFSVDKKIIHTNLLGPILHTKLVLPQMRERKSGHIVVVSSVTGKIGVPYRTSYAASKHGLQGYFDCLRAEEHENGIEVTILVPGYVNTNISVNALLKDGKSQGSKDQKSAKGMPVDQFVPKMAKAIAKRKAEKVIGKKEKYSVYLKRFLPGLLRQIVKNIKP